MTDVSIEALQNVKVSLTTFQNDISGLSVRANSIAQNCISECYQKVNDTQSKVDELSFSVKTLIGRISNLEQEINSYISQMEKIENSIPCLKSRRKTIEMNIQSLRNQRFTLQAELANAEDDDTRQQIQTQINQVIQQINTLSREQADIEYEIQNDEKVLSELQKQSQNLKAERTSYEENLIIEKKRLTQYQKKLDRLTPLLRSIKSSLDDYVHATQQFESSTSSSANVNIQSVNKCITYIEDYLSADL